MNKIDKAKLIVILSVIIATVVISASVVYGMIRVPAPYSWSDRTNDFGQITP
jgi:hypothetical protein